MICTTNSLRLVVRVCFLKTLPSTDGVMSDTQQAMLGAVFFMSVVGLVEPCRALACRVSLSRMAMRSAVEDDEVLHFVSYVAFWFVAFITAWEIADGETSFTAALLAGFRAFVVGDGDGLDFFSLGVKSKAGTGENHTTKVLVAMGGMVMFFTYLMNLLIAIFSNTYDSSHKKVWLRLHKVRVRELRDCLLSHKLCILESLGCPWTPSRGQVLGSSVFLLCFGQLLLLPLHSMPHGGKAVAISMISSSLMTAGALLLEAFPFAELMRGKAEYDWFPATQDPSRRHYLNVFCRADYDEHLFLGEEKTSLVADSIMEEHAALRKQMQGIEGQISNLGRRMDEMSEHISTKIEMLAQQLGGGKATLKHGSR